MTQLSLIDKPETSPLQWEPTRSAGLKRLNEFLPNTGRAYASQRNYDYGPGNHSNVSCLSPWIRHRLISEEEVLHAVLGRFSYSTAEKFIQEVFWRTYFKGWLEQRPQVWLQYCDAVAEQTAALQQDGKLAGRYRRATEGNTGIAPFDAWARELVETGYLHNHARMWFASIWIFTLRLPWELGADFFYRHLLDGDPASNTLSWRWVGGLHTRGKTYLARPANIEKYTDGRFNPAGQLAPQAEPLAEGDPGAPQPLPQLKPLPENEAYGLLLTEEDGLPETLQLPGAPAGIIGMTAAGDRSPLPSGELLVAFAQSAIKDALRRGSEHFGCEAEFSGADDWSAALADWAARLGLKTIVMPYAPVGPAAGRLSRAEAKLKENGVTLMRTRRRYDEVSWPHATKGFFGLKAKIPRILKTLDLAG